MVMYPTNMYVQWNLSNPDTLGTEESAIISEVSPISGGVIYTNRVFGTCPVYRGVLISG